MAKPTSANSLLGGLNKEQLRAVTESEGPLLIIAGAGTGKTAVITKKIAWLLEQQKAKPTEILALTFTDKAATEMEERVDKLLPLGFVNVEVSTFHAFCEKVLRDYGLDAGLPADFKLFNQTEAWLLVRQNLDKFDLDYYQPLGNPTKFIHALLSHFSRAKDEEISPQEYLDFAEGLKLNKDSAEFVSGADEEGQEAKRIQEVAKAYHVYQKLLLENSGLDFGDLIMQTLRLFRQRPQILKKFQDKFKYILVDEFQDTNFAQYDLVRLLANPLNNLTVVADDDQSIYKFRGASFSNILKFRQDYPDAKSVMLTQNYRSRQNILDLSYKFIQNNNPDRLEVQLGGKGKGKLSKKLKSNRPGEGAILPLCFADQYSEAEGTVEKILELMNASSLTYSDFAILVRSHDALTPFIEALDGKQVPYIYFANKGLYKKSIITDLLCYFRLLDNYHESEALYRVLNLPVFNISHPTIVEIAYLAKKKSLSVFESLKRASLLDNMDQSSLAGVAKLLSFLEKHTMLSRTRGIEQVFAQIVTDLELHKLINTDDARGIQNAKFLEAIHKKVKDFASRATDRSLKAFMNQIRLEQEAGEEGVLEFDPDVGPEAVKIMTVHAAKGLEFAYVFVVGLVDKRFPTIERKELIEIPTKLVKDILPEGDFHLQEERRLFYVAMTRAKDGLFLTRALDYGGKLSKKPSRFLVELGLAEAEKSKPTGQVNFIKRSAASKLPQPRSFSFSQISTFQKCPLEYKYRYILSLPQVGTGPMSFGQTIHKSFEKFLQAVKVGQQTHDLFGGQEDNNLPPLEFLEKIYDDNWVDDWFTDKAEMEKYRKRGREILKNFYEECKKASPKPKYLEEPFTIKVGDYLFTGKIDRADETPEGLVIIDYKTGNSRKIDKVDKEQLLVYQLAASEHLHEKVANLQYWFLPDGIRTESFLGSPEELVKLKENLQTKIQEIVDCIKNDDFVNADFKASGHQCEYRDLERGRKDYAELVLNAEGGKPGPAAVN